MARGYRVDLQNAVLESGDTIQSGVVTFDSAGAIGSGTWTWSGYEGGTELYNQTETGTYHEGVDGHVYFVPSSTYPDWLYAGATDTVPEPDGMAYSTTISGDWGQDADLSGDGGDNVITGGPAPGDGGQETIYGGAGDDSIYADGGWDTVEGGGGNDRIDGGAGNDVIYGDDSLTPQGGPESLSWSDFGSNGQSIAGGAVQDTGGMTVSVSFRNDGQGTEAGVSTTNPQYVGTGEPFATDSALVLGGSGRGDTSTTTIDFQAGPGSQMGNAVSDVSFRINDIDSGAHQDQVTVRAFGPDGEPLEVVLTPNGADTVEGATVTAGPETGTAADETGSILVEIAGPVSRIEIDYDNLADGGQRIWLTDVHFETMAAEPGDDTIAAGEGDDSVFAGAGDDTVTGGLGNDVIHAEDGADSVSGDDGHDTIFGGAGADRLDGGTGDDSLQGGSGGDSLAGGDGNDRIEGDGGDAAGNLIRNGSFENLTGATKTSYGYVATGSIPGWASTDPDVEFDLHSDGKGGTYATDGDYTLDMGASPSNLHIFQDVEGVVEGETYTLSFDAGDLSGHDNNAIEVYWGGERVDTVDPAAGGMQHYSYRVTGGSGDGSDRLEFREIGVVDNHGVQIDSVQLVGDTTGERGGADVIDGGAGDDVIEAGGGNDSVSGGSGADTIHGGEGDDTLSGGTGADSLSGGAGNDILHVAQGDTADGGTGDDLFLLTDLFESGGAPLVLKGGEGGETRGDTLQLGKLADLSTLRYTNTNDQNGGHSGSVTLDDGSVLTFSEMETVICFTPGTLILTVKGPRPVEDLRPGDKVVTRDHGPQPIRWHEARSVPATGRLAPIRLEAGALTGQERDLLVSPQHRFLFRGGEAELLFGEREVLVSATHLTGRPKVRQEPGGWVTYVHLMFDRHEIIYAEGALTESFHPGASGLGSVGGAAREELFAVFPELRSHPESYGATARRCLKKHEARLIAA
ncbi:Hint domain-containing protein [Histidinibacterium aquaticum]|uniref:Type I secretion protein n=1 Tax=Histidinibacterium aquaticum TaxID=2613962 RepID=A0A5J5GK22_9RHOB|nr:Hint domain-containing protein [Histidinibacterium aquaticum]KAA9007894.1 type I secretion protein [Histidinibacterium aquaticum]